LVFFIPTEEDEENPWRDTALSGGMTFYLMATSSWEAASVVQHVLAVWLLILSPQQCVVP